MAHEEFNFLGALKDAGFDGGWEELENEWQVIVRDYLKGKEKPVRALKRLPARAIRAVCTMSGTFGQKGIEYFGARLDHWLPGTAGVAKGFFGPLWRHLGVATGAGTADVTTMTDAELEAHWGKLVDEAAVRVEEEWGHVLIFTDGSLDGVHLIQVHPDDPTRPRYMRGNPDKGDPVLPVTPCTLATNHISRWELLHGDRRNPTGLRLMGASVPFAILKFEDAVDLVNNPNCPACNAALKLTASMSPASEPAMTIDDMPDGIVEILTAAATTARTHGDGVTGPMLFEAAVSAGEAVCQQLVDQIDNTAVDATTGVLDNDAYNIVMGTLGVHLPWDVRAMRVGERVVDYAETRGRDLFNWGRGEAQTFWDNRVQQAEDAWNYAQPRAIAAGRWTWRQIMLFIVALLVWLTLGFGAVPVTITQFGTDGVESRALAVFIGLLVIAGGPIALACYLALRGHRAARVPAPAAPAPAGPAGPPSPGWFRRFVNWIW